MTSPSAIAGRVAALHATRAAAASGSVTAAFRREQARLAGGGLPAGLAAAGTVLPGTGLLDRYAAATTLSAITGGGTAVLIFCRGAWCPYCTIALSACQADLVPQLTDRGVRLVAVSPQRPDGSLSMQHKHHLAFTVVCGPG